MDKSTTKDRLVRIETKLCKHVDEQKAANQQLNDKLIAVKKTLDAQEKENARLRLFLDQWDEYQRGVKDGTIRID